MSELHLWPKGAPSQLGKTDMELQCRVPHTSYYVTCKSLFLSRTANVLKQRAGWPGLSSVCSA